MRQILFCVESNPQARTDSMYVDTAIKTSFLIDNNVTINYIYMNGKSRYNDSKTLKRINNYTNMAQKRGTPTSFVFSASFTILCKKTSSIVLQNQTNS